MPDVTVRLWAPSATGVDAVVGSERLPLRRADGAAEYWQIDLPEGTDYLLSVDGCDAWPDPTSRWQPHGVHGPSRTFDLDAHAWQDAAWRGVDILGSVFYELHVGTFTPEGTLDAAAARLPHLAELGVGVVELMPLAAFPGHHGWGYDGVAWYAVHDPYGGPAALQRFVDAAHSLGIGVCLDVVYNHFGPAGNYTPQFAPMFTEKHHTPWGAAINLDDDHADGVRRFIIENALMWLRDFHVDCLRLDAVHALSDDSGRHILAELADAVHALGAERGVPAALVAESDLNDAVMVTSTRDGGLGMDAQWDDDVHHALHAFLTGEVFGYYADFGAPGVARRVLEDVFLHAGTWSSFRGREWGAPVPAGIDRRRVVVYSQNHDQVGNRAVGDRPDAVTQAAASALVLLSPFTPMLFQGQEWGASTPFQYFTDHDADLGALVSAGRLEEFGGHGWEDLYGPGFEVPDPQAGATRDASVLDWNEPDAPGAAAMLAFHRSLIDLRRRHLAAGGLPVAVEDGPDWVALTHGPLVVTVAARECSAPFRTGEVLAAWGDAVRDGDEWRLRPGAVRVTRA